MMGDVTKDFSRKEFKCQCGCGLNDPHPFLVVGLQQLRDLLGVRITITSACRCPDHNGSSRVRGATSSQHLPGPADYCLAADIVADVPLLDLYTAACAVPAFAAGGVGVYFDKHGPRIHVDVRQTGRARWALLHGRKATTLDVFAAAA